MSNQGGTHLAAEAPEGEGAQRVVELHDRPKGSHCALVHAGALSVGTCISTHF